MDSQTTIAPSVTSDPLAAREHRRTDANNLEIKKELALQGLRATEGWRARGSMPLHCRGVIQGSRYRSARGQRLGPTSEICRRGDREQEFEHGALECRVHLII